MINAKRGEYHISMSAAAPWLAAPATMPAGAGNDTSWLLREQTGQLHVPAAREDANAALQATSAAADSPWVQEGAGEPATSGTSWEWLKAKPALDQDDEAQLAAPSLTLDGSGSLVLHASFGSSSSMLRVRCSITRSRGDQVVRASALLDSRSPSLHWGILSEGESACCLLEDALAPKLRFSPQTCLAVGSCAQQQQ
eukprot:2099942-Pleurochrysis_carterae.AAC.2